MPHPPTIHSAQSWYDEVTEASKYDLEKLVHLILNFFPLDALEGWKTYDQKQCLTLQSVFNLRD